MKILYIISKVEAGGAQTHVAQLVSYFASIPGNEVKVLSSPGWLEKRVLDAGGAFVASLNFSNSLNPIRFLARIREINKVVEDFRPDLISCHSSVAGFITRITIRNRVPTIFTAHGWSFNSGVPLWWKVFGLMSEWTAGLFCSKIICVANFVRELGLKYHVAAPEKLVVVHNGVFLPIIKEHNLNVKANIVFVGRLAEPKRPEMLLAALGNLPQATKDRICVTIAGSGPKERQLLELAAENGVDVSVKYVENIPDLLANSDVFVLLSKWEGFPYSVLEAMAARLPVVASGVGGISEVVINGKNGFLVGGDIGEISSAIQKLVADSELSNKLGYEARKTVEEQFSEQAMFKKTEEIYKQVLQHV